MTALVIRSEARNLPLPAASVDLIATSPPYFGLRSYQDSGEHYDGQIGSEATPEAFLAALWDCTREWVRVLKPSGSLWVNLGDKYGGPGSGPQGASGGRADRAQAATYGRGAPIGRAKSLLGLPWRYALGCTDKLDLILRAEVVWSKPNGLPESITDRVRRSHETWFHFTLEPRYFCAIDEVRESYNAEPKVRGGYSGPVIASASAVARDGARFNDHNPLGKLPGSVWTIATQPLTAPAALGVDHFAAFPMELPRRIIRGWCPPSGVVLDPFGGTGTTALVASAEGRTGVSVDLSHDYSRLARWRTTDPGERARAMQVEKPATQLDGQEDLFGDVA